MAIPTAAPPLTITASQRAELRSAGFVQIPGALERSTVAELTSALDRVYDRRRATGEIAGCDPMHVLGGIGCDSAFLELVDQPRTFPVIWGELGWNIYVYHSHIDVTPSRPSPPRRPVWGWHQDGGRQNLEVDGDPRPRLSLKVAYWLSDLTVPGRGNMLVIPGSHRENGLERPEPGASFEQPEGAVPILAEPGDALIFDRRLWHSRSDNLSQVTRKAIFIAYTYRWIRPRDPVEIAPDVRARLSPIRDQLLDADADPHSHWGLAEKPIPLRAELDQHGLLDPRHPAHR